MNIFNRIIRPYVCICFSGYYCFPGLDTTRTTQWIRNYLNYPQNLGKQFIKDLKYLSCWSRPPSVRSPGSERSSRVSPMLLSAPSLVWSAYRRCGQAGTLSDLMLFKVACKGQRHLVREDPNKFVWSCTSEEWYTMSLMLEPLLRQEGHQYLTSEGTDDALIEVSYGEDHRQRSRRGSTLGPPVRD